MNTAPIDGLNKITSTLRGSGMRKTAETGTSSDAASTDLSVLGTASNSPPDNASTSSVQSGATSSSVDQAAFSNQSTERASVADTVAATQKATAESTQQAKEKLQETLDEYAKKATSLEFSIEEDTGTLLVKVLDKQTGEVIRQMPPDELIALQEQMDKTRGMLFNSMT